jgi:PAS domain S-box-containing protein
VEYEGKVIGSVTLVFSTAGIHKSIRAMQYQIILSCVVLLFLGIVCTLIISRLISAPLSSLLKTFEKIYKGNLSVRTDIDTNEEFGQLARSFDKVVDSLESSYVELTDANKTMEAKIQQRTLQLQDQIHISNKAEDKLRQTNKMITSIVYASPLPIITLTNDFKVQTASPATKNIFLWDEFEAVGKVSPFIYPSKVQEFIDQLTAIDAPNQELRFVTKGRKKSGKVLDLSIAAVASYDEHNNKTGYVLVIDDITDRLLAEGALRDSEIKYRSLIENSVIGIGILHNDIFSFVNKSLLNLLEYPNNKEFLSTPFTEIVSMNDKEKVRALYADLSSLTDSVNLEINIICYTGKEKCAELSASLLEVGDSKYLQITFIDITARKEAERKMKQLNDELEDRVIDRTSQLNKTLVELRNEMNQRSKISKELQFKSEILERTTSVCIVWNAKGECIYLSPWSLVIFGWSIDRLLGDGIWNVTRPKAVEGEYLMPDEIAEIINKERPVPLEYFTVEITTSSGETKYIKLKHSLGQNNTLITAGAEITEQVLGQRELQIMSDKLAQSLEGEKELNELKTRFISMVSHEFRTPLTVIMSCAAIIEQAFDNGRPDIGRQYLDKITKSVKTMNDLMEDVLVIGKSQSRKIENVAETDIVQFVKNSLTDIQEAYTFNAKANLIIKDEIKNFYSDEASLKHIVHNLITNALKYTTNGEDATITLEEQGDNVIFTVADHGIGIPEKDLNRLFSNFFRASNVGKIAGTGLGLHIVKQSVENLFGTITVKSIVNVGTTFTVTLPKDIRARLVSKPINDNQ